ncbi:MAG: bifunctional glutamine synthetase adenylyltransferase/deadenyltransferase, partial [Desulfobacterales bacterium]|nr:bifunctional glutamine synthetase adenylyltransferase/deadenyltransferase [Desulfobacterales bacterium]
MTPLPKDLKEDSERKLEEYRKKAEADGVAPPDDPELLETLARVFAFSDFVSGNVIREPALLRDLLESGDLQKQYSRGAYSKILAGAVDENPDQARMGKILRLSRRREMTRIAWRDLAGWADLAETMADLTHFADAAVQAALTVLYAALCEKYGAPLDAEGRQQGLVVLGMGKLGGGELNFSSDIDLIFAYPEGGRTTGG